MIDDIMAMRLNGKGMERDGQYWTEKERKKLRSAYFGNQGISEIALMLHRSENAIMQQVTAKKMNPNFTRKRNHAKRCEKQCLCESCNLFKEYKNTPQSREDDKNV